MEIPEGWRRLPLGDLFDFKNGYNTDKSAYGSGTPFVNVMEVFNTDTLQLDDIAGKVTASPEHLKLFSVLYGDVLFNRTSETREEIAMTTTYIANEPAIFGGFVIRGRQKTKSLTPEFCAYCFQSAPVRKELIARGQGAIRSNIGQKDLVKVPLLVPPIAEQHLIAKTLGTWDRAITATEALITTSEAQKKALMQQLLTGKRRLPGFEGEWREMKLGDVTSTSSGGTPKSTVEEYYDGGVLWASVADMTACKKFIYSTSRTLSPLGLKNSSARMFPENTVLIAMYASIGETAIVQKAMSTSQAILGIQAKSELHYVFLYYLLTAQKTKLKSLGQQGTQSNLNAGMMKALKIALPPFDEQKMIAEVISTSEEEVEALQAKLQTLKTEKTALMQQLLTGKRRVKLTEAAA